MPFEPIVDRAQKALQKCLEDLGAAFERWKRAESRSAEGAIVAACAEMRPHIITLSPDMREARDNLEFFDRLASSPVRNTETIIALVAKLIEPRIIVQNIARRLDREIRSQPSGGGKGVPIPPGFGAELREAMQTRGHGLEKACGDMEGMDPKTLRKILEERGAVHLENLNKASMYIREASKFPRPRKTL